jgi:ribose transport system permease protein
MSHGDVGPEVGPIIAGKEASPRGPFGWLLFRRPGGRPPAALASLSGPVLGLIGVLGLFIILMSIKGELANFLSLDNVQVLVHEGTIPAVAALGSLLVIISGGIDLSVGSVMALVTVVTMQVYRALYDGPGSLAGASVAAVAAGIAAGGLSGLANGLIITRLRVSPFVATLGMLGIARGLAVWLAERRTLAFPRGATPGWVKALAEVHAGPTVFNPGFWSLVGLAVGAAVLLRFTVLGRYCYAIGSNEATARLCGVPIDRTKVLIYVLAGLLTGWAGVLMFAHGASGDPSGAEGEELIVIAAVVIGGASLSGGQGTVVGAMLGVLILQILFNGVSIFNVPVEVQYILMGVIIIANTALSQWQQRRRE